MIDWTKKREYWLIFSGGRNGWFSFAVKKNFAHVKVLCRDEFNWLMFDPANPVPVLSILSVNIAEEAWKRIAKPNNAVLHIKVGTKRPNGLPWAIFGWLNCVLMTKYLIGVRSSACTPWGFYKKLINRKVTAVDSVTILR